MKDVVFEFLQFFFEHFLELALRIPGYMLLRLCRPYDQYEFENTAVFVWGISFWVVIGLGTAAVIAVNQLFA